MKPDVSVAVKDTEPGDMTTPNVETRSVDLRKWKIIGAVVVLLTFLVTGGIVATIYMTGHVTNNNIVKKTVFLKSSKEPTVEKVSVDKDKQIEDLQLKSKKLRVIHDFNKGLSMYQMMSNGKMVCVVTPLERSYIQRPNSMIKALNNEEGSEEVQTVDFTSDTVPDPKEKDKAVTLTYRPGQKEVDDRSVFPLEMREACAESRMFWAVKTTEKDDDSTPERKKRAVRGEICASVQIAFFRVEVCVSVTV